MYLYLYDSFLNTPKYRKILAKIETKLTDLGIGGKISRLSPLKNIKELIREEIQSGVKTIVAVGDDKTVIQIINDIAEHNVTLGIIPVDRENIIAHSLGIPNAEEACTILSARTLEKIDLGKANNTYFLSGVSIPKSRVVLKFEDRYEIRPMLGDYVVTICNLKPSFLDVVATKKRFNPSDGFLEAFIRPAKGMSGLKKYFFSSHEDKNSVIPFKKISVMSNASNSVITDGEKTLKTPVHIEVIPHKLKIIVGKNRGF